MTCIVQGINTKRELRERLAAGEEVSIEDPSIVAPFTGKLSTYLEKHGTCFLTNHPKRSWFARIENRTGPDGCRMTLVE